MPDITNEEEKSSNVVLLLELIEQMSKDEQQSLISELEEKLSKGKREHERKSFHATVDYSNDSGFHRDFIDDISDGGVSIKTSTPYSVGEKISMTFLLPEHEKRLQIEGEIARIDAQGIGVKFKASQVQKEIIKSFVDAI